ncbi:GntR family transcriptional regulator, partial [Thioclava sp. BHET1]
MTQLSASADRVDPGGAVGPQLTRILRERVISNQLPPGERISESEIALQFGVSRQPVREAFIKLAEEGLLEVRPQRGTFVRKISVPAVMDARFVREAVEADLVKLLCVTPDAALIRELERQLSAQRELAVADSGGFRRMDDLFHRTIAEAAGKSHAWAVVEGMKTQMDRVRQLSTEHFALDKLIAQHAAIVAGLARGDGAAAEAAVRQHLREILRDLPVIIADL